MTRRNSAALSSGVARRLTLRAHPGTNVSRHVPAKHVVVPHHTRRTGGAILAAGVSASTGASAKLPQPLSAMSNAGVINTAKLIFLEFTKFPLKE